MDDQAHSWNNSDMLDDSATAKPPAKPADRIPSWNLFGEDRLFPDVLHVERIRDRAAGFDWTITPHRHPHLHQFLLLLSGDVLIAIDGETFTPASPVLLSVPSGAVHGFRFSIGTEGYVVTIPVATLTDLLGSGTEEGRRLRSARLVVPPATFHGAFERLYTEHRGRHVARAKMLTAQITQIACEVLRFMPRPILGDVGAMDPRVARLIDLLAVDGPAKRSVEDYAAQLNLSSRHLARLCVAAVGATPAALIEAATMHEARRLLAYTRAPIAEIGLGLGFEDASYFSRAFRRHVGRSPRDYRQEINGG